MKGSERAVKDGTFLCWTRSTMPLAPCPKLSEVENLKGETLPALDGNTTRKGGQMMSVSLSPPD